jgi:hypothetical protein
MDFDDLPIYGVIHFVINAINFFAAGETFLNDVAAMPMER